MLVLFINRSLTDQTNTWSFSRLYSKLVHSSLKISAVCFNIIKMCFTHFCFQPSIIFLYIFLAIQLRTRLPGTQVTPHTDVSGGQAFPWSYYCYCHLGKLVRAALQRGCQANIVATIKSIIIVFLSEDL